MAICAQCKREGKGSSRASGDGYCKTHQSKSTYGHVYEGKKCNLCKKRKKAEANKEAADLLARQKAKKKATGEGKKKSEWDLDGKKDEEKGGKKGGAGGANAAR